MEKVVVSTTRKNGSGKGWSSTLSTLVVLELLECVEGSAAGNDLVRQAGSIVTVVDLLVVVLVLAWRVETGVSAKVSMDDNERGGGMGWANGKK